MANKHELGNNLKNDNELFSQLLSGETVRSFTVNKINLICRLRDEQPKNLQQSITKNFFFVITFYLQFLLSYIFI